jgi:hypothetical protein
MSNSASNDWRPTDHGFPEDFVPPPGVRYLVHGNVLTILDDRPWNNTPEPRTEEEEKRFREQVRRFRRRLEGLPEEEPPASAAG